MAEAWAENVANWLQGAILELQVTPGYMSCTTPPLCARMREAVGVDMLTYVNTPQHERSVLTAFTVFKRSFWPGKYEKREVPLLLNNETFLFLRLLAAKGDFICRKYHEPPT